jgi:hypothetical protein
VPGPVPAGVPVAVGVPGIRTPVVVRVAGAEDAGAETVGADGAPGWHWE